MDMAEEEKYSVISQWTNMESLKKALGLGSIFRVGIVLRQFIFKNQLNLCQNNRWKNKRPYHAVGLEVLFLRLPNPIHPH